MLCPYCNKKIFGFTGLQEIQKFHKHLPKCRKNPANLALEWGPAKVFEHLREQDMREALEIRARSGQ